jgi:cellulose synthase/poly-beta-1,6-N-acetylglucosamine synthase-like glycosyltransferase
MFGDRIYRGATDRKLTLLILMDKFMVVYSRLAIVETVVPQSFEEARSQWTRWKQNFWRMFIPVWQFAWHVHPVVAYMTYTRLLVTVLAPVILAYHLIAFLLGDWEALLIYLAGIGFMGGLMGLSYIASNPAEYRFALYRIAMSWLSAFWGSILTIGALVRTLNNTFTWREKVTNKKGRLINRWFTPTIELRFMELILIILVLINVYRRFFAE